MDSYSPIQISRFLLILLIVVSSSSSAFPIAKPDCEDHCGDVSIPYPFGIKESCYLQEEFFINCTNSTNAFLGGSGIEVRNITMEGQLRISFDVGYDCYDPEKNTSSDYFDPYMKLSTTLAFNSTANKLTSIGCDTYTLVYGQSNDRNTYTSGCVSGCSSKEDVLNGSCSGIGCCQTSIPNGAWRINVTIDSYENHRYVSNFNPCSYAFLVEESAFQFFTDNLTNIRNNLSVPVLVDWVVEYKVKCKEAKMNSSSYACTAKNSECIDDVGAIGYRCKCKDGFEGNPYLQSSGCEDIDECKDVTLHNCVSHSTCDNTWGSYKCNCDKGYHPNTTGSIRVDECIPDAPPHTRLYWPIYAVVGSCTIVALLSYFCHSRLMRKKEDSLRKEYFRKNGGFLLQQKLTALQRKATSYSARIFTAEELTKATNDFDDNQIIGQGGFGTVYKGELTDKTTIAIKKSKGVNQREVEQFVNEVILLSQINIVNVVKLFGCCLETEVPLLVYEFINNGTLFEHLQGIIRDSAIRFDWHIRLRIASQVARVLFYLHSFASPPIIHRDIKSSNILLDQDYMVKVADFGISRLVTVDENQLSTIVQGTPGYLDPEYLQTGILTEKSDVYSFGIVLIELLTGKKVFSTDRPEPERFLAKSFLHLLESDDLVRVVDHNMTHNIENFDKIKEVAMIAKNCIALKGEDRPDMKDVARQLETLEMEVHKHVYKALEIDRKECESSLLGEKHSRGYASSDSYPTTSTSGDLYPVTVTTTTIEHMSPIAGGR